MHKEHSKLKAKNSVVLKMASLNSTHDEKEVGTLDEGIFGCNCTP